MKKDLDKYLRRKQLKRRFLGIFLITIISTATAMLMRECSQSFDQPYNKDYQPMDQTAYFKHTMDLS